MLQNEMTQGIGGGGRGIPPFNFGTDGQSRGLPSKYYKHNSQTVPSGSYGHKALIVYLALLGIMVNLVSLVFTGSMLIGGR